MEKREGKSQVKRGLWKPEEDLILRSYVETYGEGNWADISQRSGLKRGGKSCRLRWKNYLRPNIKRGGMSPEEEDLIIRMHKLLGNRWSLIAGRLPGRTDNEVKNYWNTHLNKKCESRKRKAEELKGKTQGIDTSNKDKQCISRSLMPSNEMLDQEVEDANRGKREDSIVTTGTWMEGPDGYGYGYGYGNGFGYGIASPLAVSDYATTVFDDLQSSFAFTDLFPLL